MSFFITKRQRFALTTLFSNYFPKNYQFALSQGRSKCLQSPQRKPVMQLPLQRRSRIAGEAPARDPVEIKQPKLIIPPRSSVSRIADSRSSRETELEQSFLAFAESLADFAAKR